MAAEVEPKSPSTDVQESARITLDRFIDETAERPGALIPILQRAQSLYGYLPEDVLRHISTRLRVPFSEVTGVVTFYSYFSTVPRGKHVIRVCLGTACYVRGGNEVLERFKDALGIDVGGTTEDREFSLEVGRCFGACGLAPVVMIDDDVHQRVRPSKIQEILGQYRTEEASNE
jgi:NADH:ubiquinone oxidoreductase subunit E